MTPHFHAPLRFVAVALFALAAASPAYAIVGRTQAGRDASLVMVLARDSSRAGFCSGVVIAPRVILTAAHCVRTPSDTRVHYKDAQGAPVLLDVAQVLRHPDYRSDAIAARTRSVDLALVVTRDELPQAFAPTRIAPAAKAIGTAFTIAGFGLASENDPRSGGTLRDAQVSLREPASNLLLWLAGDAGACTGDSGGAVLDEAGALVGIIAFAQGDGTKRCGALTQAVRVAPFAPWINETLGR